MGLIKMYPRTIQYKVNGPGTEELAQGYVATPKRYSTISVEDLADHISSDSRVERSKVAVITDSLIKQIREMVLNGHSIKVPHLGTFKPKIKSSLAPNAESIDAASFAAKVTFTPSVELKRELQSSRIEKEAIESVEQPTEEENLNNLKTYFIAEVKKFVKANPDSFEGLPIEALQPEGISIAEINYPLKSGGTSKDNYMGFSLSFSKDGSNSVLFLGVVTKNNGANAWLTFDSRGRYGFPFTNVKTGWVESNVVVIGKPLKSLYFIHS